MPGAKYTVYTAGETCGHIHGTLELALTCSRLYSTYPCTIRRVETKQLNAAERKELALMQQQVSRK